MTKLLAEQIPNCDFLGKGLAKLRIYRNTQISSDPIGRRPYIASPGGWELIKEIACPIRNGNLNIPELDLEPTATDSNGLPTMLYMDVIVDEQGRERCSALALFSLMKGYEQVIDGYDQAGMRQPISLVNVRVEKTSEFVAFERSDGRARYKPKPGVRLEFSRELLCVKQGKAVSLPSSKFDLDSAALDKPNILYLLFEKQADGKSVYLATMHFEIVSSNPERGQAFLYRDLGPREVMVQKDPIPNCEYLGKQALLRIYRSTRFVSDPVRKGKYISEQGSDEHVKDVVGSNKDETLSKPIFAIDVDDGLEGKPSAVYTGMLVDEKGIERGALFSDETFTAAGTKESPLVLKLANEPNAKRNPLKIYRSRSFYHYRGKDGESAYAPKSGSLE
jgi:hypothetical protein